MWIFFICLLSACFLLNTSNFLLVWYSIICQRGNHCVLMVQKMLIFVSLTFWKWFPKMWFPRPKHHLPGSIYSFDSRLILTLRVPNTVKSSCPLYFLNLYIPLKVRSQLFLECHFSSKYFEALCHDEQILCYECKQHHQRFASNNWANRLCCINLWNS